MTGKERKKETQRRKKLGLGIYKALAVRAGELWFSRSSRLAFYSFFLFLRSVGNFLFRIQVTTLLKCFNKRMVTSGNSTYCSVTNFFFFFFAKEQIDISN